MNTKFSSNNFNSLTNGELYSFCEANHMNLASNPSRDQMISAIRKQFPNQFRGPTKTSQIQQRIENDPFISNNVNRKSNLKLNTPRINFSSPSNQPTPILANQNAEYEKMWERRLGQQKKKTDSFVYNNNSRALSPSLNTKYDQVSSPVLPIRTTKHNKNKSMPCSIIQLEILGIVCVCIVILVIVS